MGLFSFLNKNKQETTAEDSGYYRADDDTVAAQARSKRASSAGEPAARRGKAKAAADPVLPEKKRARRRLVGAIALALAVAVGLPMVLDSEPKPLASDIDIRIPSKDKPPVAAPVSVPAADALGQREEIVAPPTAPDTAREVAEVNTATAKPEMKMLPKEAIKPGELKPVDKAAKPVARHEEKPAAKTAEAPKDGARALAILEGKPADAAGQKYVVQVAALASQEKVDELRGKLSAAGINSFTTRTGDLIRVRVGPLSRDEAEKVRAKLSKIGLGGSLVPA
jgi:DedD protein